MAKCPKCGKLIPADRWFCEDCWDSIQDQQDCPPCPLEGRLQQAEAKLHGEAMADRTLERYCQSLEGRLVQLEGRVNAVQQYTNDLVLKLEARLEALEQQAAPPAQQPLPWHPEHCLHCGHSEWVLGNGWWQCEHCGWTAPPKQQPLKELRFLADHVANEHTKAALHAIADRLEQQPREGAV